MATHKSAWGIEVGAGAVKAIKLERHGDSVQVVDFAFVEHKKVLTTPDLDQNEVIRLSSASSSVRRTSRTRPW